MTKRGFIHLNTGMQTNLADTICWPTDAGTVELMAGISAHIQHITKILVLCWCFLFVLSTVKW